MSRLMESIDHNYHRRKYSSYGTFQGPFIRTHRVSYFVSTEQHFENCLQIRLCISAAEARQDLFTSFRKKKPVLRAV